MKKQPNNTKSFSQIIGEPNANDDIFCYENLCNEYLLTRTASDQVEITFPKSQWKVETNYDSVYTSSFMTNNTWDVDLVTSATKNNVSKKYDGPEPKFLLD